MFRMNSCKIHSFRSCYVAFDPLRTLALLLLVLRVLADDHDAALALDDLALLADGLNRRSNFHVHFLRCCWGWFYALPRQVILPLVRS